jgi:hypothetical protein
VPFLVPPQVWLEFNQLRDLPPSLRFILSRACAEAQRERAGSHGTIFDHEGKRSGTALTKPEVLNPAGWRAGALGRDCAGLEVKYSALVQVVKTSHTRRIRALGEHGGSLLMKSRAALQQPLSIIELQARNANPVRNTVVGHFQPFNFHRGEEQGGSEEGNDGSSARTGRVRC